MAGVNDLDTAEALALFSVARTCEDVDDWVPERQQPHSWTASCGALNADGSSAGLLVELLYRWSPKTKTTYLLFTVHKRNAWGSERAYQLDIEQHIRKLPLHDLPHEHFGKERTEGSSDWATWSFEEALRYFSDRTKITFNPPVFDPHNSFQLKRQ